MSVGGPQIPQNQQNIGLNDPVQQPGQDTGEIKTKKGLKKKIGHQFTKLLPGLAKKLFSGHRSVQALHPNSVGSTAGLKEPPAKLPSLKPLSERNAQPLDVATKLGLEDVSSRQRRDSSSSVDLGFIKDDTLSIASGTGYDSVKFDQSEFIDDDNGYMTADDINKSAPPPQADLEDEDQYARVDDLDLGSVPNSSATTEENTNETTLEIPDTGSSGQDIPDEGVNRQASQSESVPDEPTISGEDVLTRKYAAYEQLLDNDDFGALEEKLANTNNYETAKKVAQLALEKQGKNSLVFMIAQNRMHELKADQLFDQLGGFSQGADYDLVREQAAEAINQNKYSSGYQARVMELVDQKLDQYREVIANTPPPIPGKSAELMEELETAQLQENQIKADTPVEDEPPPLPPRSETPTETKKRGGRIPGFLRRGR